MTPATTHSDESARRTLIEIAARLTDHETRGNSTEVWLRAFRKNFRHVAVTYGMTFSYASLGVAERSTEAALDPKAEAA